MRDRQLPDEVEFEIIRRLFNALPQVLCVTTGLVTGSVFVASVTGDPWLWVIFALGTLTSAARIGAILEFRRRRPDIRTLAEARLWERAYSWPAIAFSCAIAMLTVRAFQLGNVDAIILTIGLTMALTAGSCARVLRYWICTTLSTITLGTLIVSLVMTGDPAKVGIGALFALYLYSVFESSQHIVGQVEALLLAERRLDAEARLDPLTGLANRRAFDEALSAAAGTGGFALLLLDLDGFKAVNDRFGHAAGDDLLRQVSDRLSGVVRHGDVIARLGGDEFAVILPDADLNAAKSIADRAVTTVGLPYVVMGQAAVVGTSIGLKMGIGGDDPNSVKHAADEALYAAKRAGKGVAVTAPLKDAA